MPLTLSDLDIEAMETINYSIDRIMHLPDEEYLEASEKIFAIIRRYLSGLIAQADLVAQISGVPLIYMPEGGSA